MVARGAHLTAIGERGLRVVTPLGKIANGVAAMRELAGVQTPTTDKVYALLRWRTTSAAAAR